MNETVISAGMSDSALYLQAVANVAQPFAVESASGNYPLVGNVLVNRRLANTWLVTNLLSRAFVDGMGVTSAGAESENVGFLRMPLMYMPPRIKRTLGAKLCANGTFDGTQGNNEPFNKNLPHGVATNGYDLKFLQEYDEAAQISKVNMRMIGNSLDLLGQYTSNIPKTVGMLMDGDVLATHVGAALAYANANGNRNIIAFDPTNTDEGYLQGIMNSLASMLANVRGSYAEGIISYPREKSVYVMRWSFFNKLMTFKNGALNMGDIAQKIAINGYLDDSGTKLLGNYIYGRYNGIYIKVLPDELFDTAAATLGLTEAQYQQFNKVVAYIANAEGTYFGMSATVTDIDKSPTTSIGYIIRNDWGWGVKCVRPSSVALVVESSTALADFTNPVTSFDDISSPANMEGLIQEYQDKEVSDKMIQRLGAATQNLVTTVTVTVQSSASGNAPITNADVVCKIADGVYASVANNGDGTYTFTMPRASAGVLAITAEGFENAVADITAVNTAGATYAKTVSMTVES